MPGEINSCRCTIVAGKQILRPEYRFGTGRPDRRPRFAAQRCWLVRVLIQSVPQRASIASPPWMASYFGGELKVYRVHPSVRVCPRVRSDRSTAVWQRREWRGVCRMCWVCWKVLVGMISCLIAGFAACLGD